MLKKILQLKTANPIIGFAVGFIAIFLVLYFGNQFFIGISTPGNLYVSMLDNYFNYIQWLRSLLLHTSSIILNIFGMDTYATKWNLVLANGDSIKLVYKCLGIGIMSVWVAFVIAFPQQKLNKLKYALLGIFAILFINIIRIIALAIVFSNNDMTIYKHIDQQHFFYNVACYIIIFWMMKRWIDKSEMFYKK